MKKIFRLLLLGLLTVSVLSPSVVNSTEVQSDQEISPTIKKVIDGVGPLSTYQNTITLSNGESFELSRKFIFYTHTNPNAYPNYAFYVNTIDAHSETFSLEVSVPECESIEPDKIFIFSNNHGLHNRWLYQPEIPEIYDVLFKITNYSSDQVTYYISISLTY